jgi:TPR repeat protein
MGIRRHEGLFIVMAIIFGGCASTTHPIATADDNKDNNHIIVKSKNTSDNGSNDKVIFKGKNNILEFDYASSEYKSANHNNVIIVDGNQNNTKIIQKNVKDFSNASHDTLLIKGNKQKNEIMDSNETTSANGSSGKNVVSSNHESIQPEADYKDFSDDTDEVYIEEVDSMYKIKDAFTYYINKSKKGDASAFYRVGLFYQNGIGIRINALKAIQYFEISARKNYADAQYILGDIYENGFLEISPDMQKASYYYALAAKNGNENARQKLKEISN